MRNHFFPIIAVLILTFVPCPAAHAAMDIATLQSEPMWLPKETTVKKDVAFQSGLKLSPKHKIQVIKLENDGGVRLKSGNREFTVDASITNLLADAEKYRASFTPEQQKLTTQSINNQKKIWPFKVKMTSDVKFTNGIVLRTGEECALYKPEGQQLQVLHEREKKLYTINAAETDFYQRVFNEVANPGRGRLFDEVYGNAIRANTGKPAAGEKSEAKYLALYWAAATCGYCDQTTPDVLAWYNSDRPGKGTVELVMVAGDKDQAKFMNHLASKKFTSLAVGPERGPTMYNLIEIHPKMPTPWLWVVDRDGKTLIESARDGAQPKERTLEVLLKIRELEQKLAAQASAD